MSCECVDYGDGCMHDWRPIAMGAQVEGEALKRGNFVQGPAPIEVAPEDGPVVPLGQLEGDR